MVSTDTQLQLACKKKSINKDIRSKPLCKDKKNYCLSLASLMPDFLIFATLKAI